MERNDECYATIPDFPNYAVSNYGDVLNITTGRYIKKFISKGYYRVSVYLDKKQYTKSVHRFIAICFIPNPQNKTQVDHIDNNKLNNHISNLRWATKVENMHNLNKSKNSFSKYLNIYKSRNRFRCHIEINGRQVNIGSFNTEEEAVIARNRYIIEHGLNDGFRKMYNVEDI